MDPIKTGIKTSNIKGKIIGCRKNENLFLVETSSFNVLEVFIWCENRMPRPKSGDEIFITNANIYFNENKFGLSLSNHSSLIINETKYYLGIKHIRQSEKNKIISFEKKETRTDETHCINCLKKIKTVVTEYKFCYLLIMDKSFFCNWLVVLPENPICDNCKKSLLF